MDAADLMAAEQTAATYYNSDDADQFYAHVWGGEDIPYRSLRGRS